MRDPAGGMALRTAVLTRLVDRVRGSIETSTMEDLQRRRATVYPGVAPFTWLTGAIDPTVRRTEITVSARDGAAIPLRCYHDARRMPRRRLSHRGDRGLPAPGARVRG